MTTNMHPTVILVFMTTFENVESSCPHSRTQVSPGPWHLKKHKYCLVVMSAVSGSMKV